MALYMPTNITPDLKGQIGNGVVAFGSTSSVPVTWQVNGNSPMTKFRIEIEMNDNYSTPVYDTGELTTNCPFYGLDATGKVQPFTCYISTTALQNATGTALKSDTITVTLVQYANIIAQYGRGTQYFVYDGEDWLHNGMAINISQLFVYTGTPIAGDTVAVAAGMENGFSYKLTITQWWSGGSVRQTSASAFITRAHPTLTLPVPNPCTSRILSLSATYSQAQGDALNWARWQLAKNDTDGTIIYDTGYLYGVSLLSFTYDGLFNGQQYKILLTVQTESGMVWSQGWTVFDCTYAQTEIYGLVTAVCNREKEAIRVFWDEAGVMNGVGVQPWSIGADGRLRIQTGGSVTWATVNGEPFEFEKPWSVIWRGEVQYADALLFRMVTGSGTWDMTFDNAAREIQVNGDEIFSNVPGNAKIVIFFTVGISTITVNCLVENAVGGLAPSTSLTPSASLVPQGATGGYVYLATDLSQYTPSNLLSVSLGGNQYCEFLQVIKGEISGETIQAAIGTGVYVPQDYGPYYLSTAFSTSGLNAGNLPIGDATVTGFSLYRERFSEISKVGDYPVTTTSVYDHFPSSQQGPYTYQLYLQSSTTYATLALVSNIVCPTWWNWTLLECTTSDDLNFTVIRQFKFGKNLSSGSIGNGSNPNVFDTFSRYPNVQASAVNRKSGTLSSLIGVIDGECQYSDTLEDMDLIYGLSTRTNDLFLKNRKGDLLKIEISGEIGMSYDDKTQEQALTVSLPWVEVGPVSGLRITEPYVPED